MMSLAMEYAEPAAHLVAWGARFLIQSTLLIGLGLAACGRLGRRSAALRSLVLRGTLLAALVCPMVSSLAAWGGIELVIRPETRTVSTSTPGAGLPRTSAERGRSSGHIGARVAPEPVSSVPAASNTPPGSTRTGLPYLYSLLGGVWLTGVVLLLGRLGCHCVRASRLRHSARPAPEGVAAIAREMSVRMGLRTPSVMMSAAVKSPLLLGIMRPAILLPAACPEIADAQVFAHELAHLRRRDCLWSLGYRLARDVCFFQPLMWILGRQMEQTNEEACDDFVLSYGAHRRSYVTRLVEMAAPLGQGRLQPLAIGAVSLRSSLGRRVQRIVSCGTDHGIQPGRWQTLGVALLGGLAVFCASFLGVRVAVASQERAPHARGVNEPNLAPLVRALDSGVWQRREQAAIELAQADGTKTAAIPALVQALADEQWQVRKAAAVALVTVGPDAQGAIAALTTALHDVEWQVRRPAAEALAAIGAAAAPAVGALSDVLSDEEWQVRRAAATALVAIGPAARPSLPQLVRTLDDEQWHVRESAALALGAIGPEAAGAIPDLIKRLDDPEWRVRRAAAGGLERIAAGDKAAIPEIIGALRDPEWRRRQAAAASLEKLLRQ